MTEGSRGRLRLAPPRAVPFRTVQSQTPHDLAARRLVGALVGFGVLPAAAAAVVVALLVAPLWGLVAFAVVAGVWAAAVLLRVRGSLERVLAASGARRGEPGLQPRWENVVEGLGLRGGVHDPELWYVDAASANAAALVRGERVVLVATDGLLRALGPVEQEAVAANLLCRVRDGSAHYATLTAGVFGSVLASGGGADRLVAEGLGEQRSVHSDLAAVGLTRYPPGLARALRTMSEVGTEVPGVPGWAVHVWVAPTGSAGESTAVAASAQQPLPLRVAVLEEL